MGLPAERCTGGIARLRRSAPAGLAGLVAMRVAVAPGRPYADGPFPIPAEPPPAPSWPWGDALQAYNSPDRGILRFSELEVHAPAAALPPGGSTSQEVEILVCKGRIDRVRRTATALLQAPAHL